MLLDEGRVRLYDPVSKFIPEFKGSKVVVQDFPANAAASGTCNLIRLCCKCGLSQSGTV
jgi:CubicO group peptidase (beta-lactamase class C family)